MMDTERAIRTVLWTLHNGGLAVEWSARTADSITSTRYEGAERYKGEVLTVAPPPPAEAPRKQEQSEPEKKPAARDGSHIDQLLQAKRKKTEHDEDNGRGTE